MHLLIIDSLTGYVHAMPDERFLTIQLQELLMYLTQKGLLTLLDVSQHCVMGRMDSPVDVSYLSDTIVAVSFFETEAQLRRAITVVKKKHGPHSTRIHELTMEGGRVQVRAQALLPFRNLMVPHGSGPDPRTGRDAPP